MMTQIARRLCASASISLIALLSGCGTPGAPQPPSLNLAKPVDNLKAVRIDNQVVLTWTPPSVTTDGAAFRHSGPTKICQVQNHAPIDQCVAVGTVNPPLNAKTATAKEQIIAPGGPGAYVTYAIEVDNDRGRAAGLSNQVEVPAMAITEIANARASLTSDAVVVSAEVTPVNEGIKQTLELRRRERGSQQESTAAQLPIPDVAQRVELRDENFDWERTYEYRLVVSADARLPNGSLVRFDGAGSAPVDVVAHDTFPPAVPTGVQAVYSGVTQSPSIDLTWDPDTDRDLAGYFVYRRSTTDTSAVKLNTTPLPAPAFSDSKLTAGSTYFYSVSAIDVRGNESQRSREASETAPK